MWSVLSGGGWMLSCGVVDELGASGADRLGIPLATMMRWNLDHSSDMGWNSLPTLIDSSIFRLSRLVLATIDSTPYAFNVHKISTTVSVSLQPHRPQHTYLGDIRNQSASLALKKPRLPPHRPPLLRIPIMHLHLDLASSATVHFRPLSTT